ncbi:MAG TPA: hypothetical protein VMH22_13735 [bacterium]|nr:hypothetical protein [bacterium]
MRVAVFSTHVLWTPHYETELDIMQEHLDAGDHVTHVVCDRGLSTCDLIVSHNVRRGLDPLLPDRDRCDACVRRRNNGARLLKGRVRRERIAAPSGVAKARLQSGFVDKDELRHYVVDGFDAGEAALSSVISFCRDPKPDMREHSQLVQRYLRSCDDLYSFTQDFIRRAHPDRVYVFNGRFAYTRAVLRACQANKTECFVHDRGHDIQHYAIYENALPHDLEYVTSLIRSRWAAEPDIEKKAGIADAFYSQRRRGEEQSWFSFVGEQKPGLLPEGWNGAKRNVAIFCSSEDEFEAAGQEWRNPLYSDQLEAIQRILADPRIAGNNEVHLYLRVHPNLRNVDNPYTRALRGLSQHNLTVIQPDSPVSTYALMDSSTKVLSFGSTAGIEAVYWGKPSMLAGMSFYRSLGGNYVPKSQSELAEMLVSDLAPKPKEAALVYGYYMGSYGRPHKYYQALGIRQGTFKGRDLQQPAPGLRARMLRGREMLLRRWRRAQPRQG